MFDITFIFDVLSDRQEKKNIFCDFFLR